MLIDLLYDFNRGRAAETVTGPWEAVFRSVQLANQRKGAEAIEALQTLVEPSAEMRVAAALIEGRLATLQGDLSAADEALSRAEMECAAEALDLEVVHACLAHRRSVVARLQSRFEESISLGLRSEELYTSQGWTLDAALAAADIALALIQKGDLGAGIETLARVSDVIEREGTPTQYTAIQANLAVAMQRSGDMTGAERVNNGLLDRAPFNAPSPERAALLQNVAVILKLGGRFAEALNRYEEARSMLDPSIHVKQVVRIENGMADLYYRLEQYDRMKEITDALLSTSDDVLRSSPTLSIELALVRFRRFALDANIQEALAHCEQGRNAAREHRLWEEHDQLLTGALEYVRDASVREELLTELAEIRGQRLSSVSAMVTTVVEQRARYEQERAAQELARQQERTQVIMETQERTMEEIGRDLHDSIGNDLSLALRWIDLLTHRGDGTTVDDANLITELRASVQQASQDARRISHMMAAPGLDGSTLGAAVSDLLHSAQEAQPDVVFSLAVRGDLERVSAPYAKTVYRCLQTLLQNVMHHAQATAVDVQVTAHADELVCSIDDNGIGFDPNVVVRGLGLRSIVARVAAHGGSVAIDSTPGHGVFVSLHMPLGQTRREHGRTDQDLSAG